MASLSNINGIFDVHSTGAIQFNGNHGTAGQILKSNGNAAPTWVAASTVIGGPYLPLTGGTLSGATATATGINFTVGGNLFGTSATFSGNVAAATFNGLAINTTGTNNVANQIVRTEANGYVNFGWINSISGATTSTITRITASNDAYLRYVTPATFRTQITDPYYAPAGTVSGVTSVATGNGLTGGTITSTGTLTMSGDYTGSLSITGANLAGASFSDPDIVLSITDEDTTASIRNKMTGSSAITKISDATAPAPGCFQVNGSYYPQGFGPYYKISEGDEFTFEFWMRYVSGTATYNLLYAGSNFYNAAGTYLGNSQRYWGESSLNINANTGTGWYHVSGTLGPSRGTSNGNIPTTAESMRLLFLFNYNPNGTIVTNYCGLKVYKSNPTVTKLYRKTLGSEASSSGRNRDLVVDSNGDIYSANIYNTGWFRNQNSGEGLYNTATANHFYSDGQYWNVGYSGTTGIRLRNGSGGTILGYLYAETSGQFGLLDKDGHWTFRTDGTTETELRANNVVGLKVNSGGDTHVLGQLTVGNSTSSDIFFTDTDENTRRMHCNSNRLGFLSLANNWSAYSDNAGNWIMSYAATVAGTLTTNGQITANSSIYLKDRITLPASGLSSVSGRPPYAIYQEGGAWTNPFPDLCIAMHTGIKLGANASYNGIRFYDDYTMATQVMAVNDSSSPIGAGHVYVNNVLQAGSSLRAPIFYDTNTNYYGDFASTSVLNALQFNYTQHGSANNIRMGNSTTMNAISSGTNNAAFGVEALGGCSTGSRNFAYGYAALNSLSSGGSNIAMGDATGYNVTSGSNNLLFGQNAGRTGYQSPYQSIAGVTSGSNQIHMGNESHSTARIQISWTVNSDSRDKTDVTPIDVGLDFVKDLNPVTFRWDKRSDYEDRTPTGENKLEELTLGFLAQEVEEVEKSYGYDVADKTNLVVDRDVDQDHFGITYEKMIPILVKAIQELEIRVKELENK
jgi:hypothetical protein